MINYQKNFEEKGYIVLRSIFSNSEIKKIKLSVPSVTKQLKKYEGRYIHFTKDGRPNTIHNINDLLSKNHYLNRVGKKKKLLSVIKKILRGKPKLRNVEFFLKPKKTGNDAPFHQDNFYWNVVNGEAVNVWIACSKVNYKNGGVIYLEGSQKLGVIKHILSNKPGSSQQIPNEVLAKVKKGFKGICPRLKPGDCIVHSSEVIHGSKKNISNIDREGLVISFIKKDAIYDQIKLRLYKNSLEKNIRKMKKNSK